MASRHIKCSCTRCDTIWRMSRMCIKNAGERLSCPACQAPAIVGNKGISEADWASIRRSCAEVAEGAAAGINAHNVQQADENREELERRRAHIARRKRGVCTGQPTTGEEKC